MKKAFYIDGGAGRIICALPALEKYVKTHPEEDVVILIAGWDSIVWGNQLLQDITYNLDTKGIFDNVIKDCDVIITPEPYRVPDYFNQKINLAEAFDREINGTKDHSDISIPKLILSKAEEKAAANILADVKQQQQKSKTIVIQPFGRSAREDRGDIIDDSSRGLDSRMYLKLVKKLATKYNVVLFAEKPFFHKDDTYSFKFEGDLRMWLAVIEGADYFIGCDSVGQHMARAFNKPGSLIVGSTFVENISYPDWFNLLGHVDAPKKYSPIRLCGLDNHLADRFNDSLMEFTDEEIEDMYKSIVADIEKKVK